MFDGSLPEPAALSGVEDAVLVGAIAGWAQVAAAAEARGLAAVAELVRRRCDPDDDQEDRNWWVCDPWAAAAAEVSAALNIGHGRAVGQLDLSVTLRDRLPRVNAGFLAGQLTGRLVSALAWRTLLIEDADTLARLDAALAEHAAGWGRFSEAKLVQAVDEWVAQFDPAALRRTREAVRGRSLTVGDRDDTNGTTSVWGRLLGTDATLLDRRLTAMAHAVCDADPRTLAQRRADALGALAAGADHLACRCGAPACPAAADDGRASYVVLHLVADPTALTAAPDPGLYGEQPLPEPAAPVAPVSRPTAGIILGGSIVPGPLLAELIHTGAQVRHVTTPGEDPEPRYRPTTALDEFVRIRDLTCRHPGCDRPAEFCDLDHTIPWPAGPTHPSNLKPYCRLHHLLKTFWTGEGGWTDVQQPDGTLTFTAPSGLTYTTRPGSTLLFPTWNTTTTALPPAALPVSRSPGATLMMPRRKRTRTQNRASRIRAERAYNEALIAERKPRF